MNRAYPCAYEFHAVEVAALLDGLAKRSVRCARSISSWLGSSKPCARRLAVSTSLCSRFSAGETCEWRCDYVSAMLATDPCAQMPFRHLPVLRPSSEENQ